MSQQTANRLTVADFSGGVNYAKEPHKIYDNQLSDLSNMEYRDGVLAKRSGYETLLSGQGIGEILATREFMDKLYFACTNAIVRIDPATDKVEILARDLQLEKPGSFVIKENLMYYFSGDGIYKMNPILSSFGVEEQNVFSTSAVCELAPGIYTDGNTVADFGSYEIVSYPLGNDPVDFDFICCRDTTVYGVKKPHERQGDTTVTVLSLTEKDGIYTLQSQESYTAVMPLHDPYQYGSTGYFGIFIRYIDALPDTLYLQCDYIVSTSSQNLHSGFLPLVMRFNLQTKQFETDCGISNATACYELYSRWGDTVMLMQQDFAHSKHFFILRRDGQETKISMKQTLIDYTSSGNEGKQHLTHLTAVAEDRAVITYRNTNSVFQTELWHISENGMQVLATTNEVIDDLYRIGNNFYELPVWRSFYTEIGLGINERMVTPYYFGDGRIERGHPYISDKRGTYSLSAFGSGERLVSSENSAVKIDGYVPVVLTAMYVSDTKQYETVLQESYNSLTRKARVQFSMKVDKEVEHLELPIPYHTIEKIESTRSTTVTFAPSGENTRVSCTSGFRLGEELILIFKDNGGNIAKCNLAISYDLAGEGTRIFAAGNPDAPATYYVSEVDNFEYFPEQNYQMLSDGGQAITGFARHYQDLVFFKDKSISMMLYGDSLGNVQRVHDGLGCDMPGSIQIINNDVVFGNSERGIFLLSLQSLTSERNVQPIGLHISGERGIGQFSSDVRKKAVSLDFQNRYFLAVGDRIYLWDYLLSPYSGNQESLAWFEYRGIEASCLFVRGNRMAFCPKGQFALNLFNGSCNDNGKEISAFFRTKAFDFGDSTARKAVHQLWLSMDGNRDMELTLDCADERETHTCVPLLFRKNRMANVVTARLKLKRVLFCSLTVGNCQRDTAFDISGIRLEFQYFKSKR